MESILSDLYHGLIYPEEQYNARTEEFRALLRERASHYDDFLRQLTPPLAAQFEKILDEQVDDLPFEFQSMFIGGFRLGARIMLEVLRDDC